MYYCAGKSSYRLGRIASISFRLRAGEEVGCLVRIVLSWRNVTYAMLPMKLRRPRGIVSRIFVHPLDAMILLIVWAAVNGGLYVHYGVKVVTDSPRYLDYAQKIADGLGWYEPHNVWYLGYVVFVLMVKGLFTTNGAIVAAQVLMHGLAAAILYRTSYRLFVSRGSALITALLFLGWIEVPAWNFYVLAESWYVSLICLVLYCIVSFDGSPKRWSITTLVVLLTFITKPTGIAVLVAYGVFLVSYYSFWLARPKLILSVLAILGLPILYELINQMLSSFVLIENYATGEVVYGMSTTHGYVGKEQLVLPTGNLLIPATHLTPIPRLFVFVVSNPAYFVRLALTKAWYFLGHVRPYYSWLHNAFTVATLYPLYLLASKVLWQRHLAVSVGRFLLAFVIIHTVAIMFTSVDWDGRFLMPLLPVVFLLGGRGLTVLVDTMKNR